MISALRQMKQIIVELEDSLHYPFPGHSTLVRHVSTKKLKRIMKNVIL